MSGTIVINNPRSYTGTITNFLPGDNLDLVGVNNVTGVTLGANNVLTVATGTGSFTLQLDHTTGSPNYASYIFSTVSDGQGGAYVVNPLFSDNFSTYTQVNNWTAPASSGWVVAAGSVDMCGPSNQPFKLGKDPLSGITNGNEVDLGGTTGVAGVLQTAMTFAAGTYTVSFDLAGDQRSGYNNNSGTTVVSLGNWSVTETLTYNAALKNYTFTFTTTTAGHLTFAEQSVSGAGSNNNVGNILAAVEVLAVACYLRGTHLLTDQGEARIETLKVGDQLVTASGEARPIKWLGRRSLDLTRHPGDPIDIQPVCVAKGAFGENLPARDLYLSPEHNLAFEGALIPVKILINGRTIAQQERRQVEYWHVELDTHDVIFAEGLASETYLDTGNRSSFDNGGAVIEAFPDFAPRHWTQTCLPMEFRGPSVESAKTVLIKRLAEFGVDLTGEADLHVRADGARIAPLPMGANRFCFVIPAGRREIALVSHTFVPAHAVATSYDTRSLGVSVKRLQIDAEDVALDSPLLSEGWREPEAAHRWTDGCAVLPPDTRLVVVDLAATGRYWREPLRNLVALSA